MSGRGRMYTRRGDKEENARKLDAKESAKQGDVREDASCGCQEGAECVQTPPPPTPPSSSPPPTSSTEEHFDALKPTTPTAEEEAPFAENPYEMANNPPEEHHQQTEEGGETVENYEDEAAAKDSEATESGHNCEDRDLRKIVESSLESGSDNLKAARRIESEAAVTAGASNHRVQQRIRYVNCFREMGALNTKPKGDRRSARRSIKGGPKTQNEAGGGREEAQEKQKADLKKGKKFPTNQCCPDHLPWSELGLQAEQCGYRILYKILFVKKNI